MGSPALSVSFKHWDLLAAYPEPLPTGAGGCLFGGVLAVPRTEPCSVSPGRAPVGFEGA